MPSQRATRTKKRLHMLRSNIGSYPIYLFLSVYLVFALQVLEPSRVLSVIHTFDCHTGEVTAVRHY